jgi:hypothetical protein
MGSTFVIAGQKSVKRVFSLDDPAIHQSMVLQEDGCAGQARA